MSRLRFAPLLLVLVALGAHPAAAEEAPSGLVVERHELTVAIDPAAHGISVKDRMTVRGGGALRFRLARTLTVADPVRLDGRPVPLGITAVDGPRGKATQYTIALGEPGRHVVEVAYEGTIHDPVKKARDLAFVVGDRTTGTISEEGVFLSGSSGWVPYAPGSMPYYDLEVSLPEPWVAVSQGELVSEESGEARSVSRWKATIPSDALYLQAGKFHLTRRKHGDVTLGVALLQPNPQIAKLFLDEMAQYLDLYQPILGPFPHPRFDVVENFFTSGYGMPGYTLLGGDVIRHIAMMTMRNRGKIPPGYIDHELMHCWWGNGVYLDYAFGNWCEGLTSYCTNYYRKELEGEAEGRAHRERVARRYSVMVHPEKEYTVREFRGKTEDFENDIGYGKCSMIFHMVRREVGDTAFWKALRDVATRFKGKKAGWADFEAAFETASEKDLTTLFAQWLDRKGGPVLAIEKLETSPWSGKPSHVRGEIVQRGEPWPLSVDVVLRRGDEVVRRQTVRCEGARTPFDFAFMGGTTGLEVSLDPEFHLFRLYPAAAVPACLNATVEDRGKLVIPADGVEAYAQAAQRAVAEKGGDVKAPGEVTEADLEGRSLFLLGAPWENPAVAKVLEGLGDVEIGRESIRIGEQEWKGKALSLLASFRHPASSERFVTVYLDLDRASLRRAPRFFFYGWDGFVVYDQSRPVERGALESGADPAVASTGGPTPRAPSDPEPPPGGEATVLLRALTRLEGRGAGQPGERKAEDLVAKELYRAGLTVRRQPFSFEVLDFTGGTLQIGEGKDAKTIGGAFVPFVWSQETDGPVTGTLRMLRGRGIRIVPWPDAKDTASWSELTYPSRLPAAARERLEKARAAGQPADPWRFASGAQARSLDASREDVEFGISIDPRVLEGLSKDTPISFEVRFDRRRIDSANVVGTIESGGASAKDPVVVLGAHYDGLGREGDRVFESADDNASGIAAMILAARDLARRPGRKTVVVVAFGAEEWGLRGSRAYVRPYVEPWFEPRPIAAMINLDTIGRTGIDDVYVVGRSKHPELAESAMAALKRAGIGIGRDIDRFAFAHGSDHWPFHLAKIPAIDLWSSDYKAMNSAEDTLEHVDAAKVERIASALAILVRELGR